MAIEDFTEYRKEDRKKYNLRRWWLCLTWSDLLDRASDICPDKVEFVTELPVTKIGKVDKKALREDIRKRVEGVEGRRKDVDTGRPAGYSMLFCHEEERFSQGLVR